MPSVIADTDRLLSMREADEAELHAIYRRVQHALESVRVAVRGDGCLTQLGADYFGIALEALGPGRRRRA